VNKYTIEFNDNSQVLHEVVEASNPGHAFTKFIKAHPGITPVSAMREGRHADGYGYTVWNTPSLKRPDPLPAIKVVQETFGF
jgi:hypothetical protein